MFTESESSEREPSFVAGRTKTSAPIHVGLVVFHALAAHQLVSLIKASNMIPVILADGVRGLQAFPVGARVVILIDLWGQPLRIVEYLNGFSAAIPNCTFLALDSAKPGAYVAGLLRAGFAGFITHEESVQLLGPAVEAVADGQVWISPEITRLHRELTFQRATALGMLTARENQILDLLRRRYSNKEIAVVLQISESTVKFHVSHVLMKLRANHRRELTDNKIFPDWLGKPERKSAATATTRTSREAPELPKAFR